MNEVKERMEYMGITQVDMILELQKRGLVVHIIPLSSSVCAQSLKSIATAQ